jgi:phosphoglycerate dehydrogenase-like enzyme
MSDEPLIAVASRSFSANPELCRLLGEAFPRYRLNSEGLRLSGDLLAEFLSGAAGAVVGVERVDAGLLARLPDLRVISKYGVGLDSIDVEEVAARHIVLATATGTNSQAVAEMALLLMLGVLRRIPEAVVNVREQRWAGLTGGQLAGRTVGLVGVGNAGGRLAGLLRAFDCRVLGYDPAPRDVDGVEYVPLDRLLSTADVVSLHAPLTDATRGLIGRREIGLMRPTAILVNTARGALIDEAALSEALSAGRLAGAGLDVLDNEPPTDWGLAAHPHVFLTPHLSGSTNESNMAMGLAALDGLVAHRDALLA